jgi:hypothetical protein
MQNSQQNGILDVSASGLILPVGEKAMIRNVWTAECRDADGNLIWQDGFENLMPTVGKNNMLDNHWSASAFTAAWFVGLVDGGSAPSYVIGDTMASHAGWTESTVYSNATRVAPAWSAASGGSKAFSAGVVFNINATGTIAGLFLASNSTKGGTTGTLASEGNFSGGNQPVVNTNTLTVNFTSTLT